MANKISGLPTTVALTLSDLLEVEQPAEAAGTRSRKSPVSQLLALIYDNDPTLAGDSPNKAATQQAVKAFVEDAVATAIAALAPPASAVAMQLVADTSSTADSDPGTGKLRWNHATQGSATSLFVDDSSDDAVSLISLWPALHAGGTIFLQHATDQDTWQIWEITVITDATGYAKLAVSNLVNGGSFANGDPILATIDRAQVITGGVTTVNGASGTPLVLTAFAIAFSDETTAITAGTNKARWINPSSKAFNVVDVAASLNVAQASGSIFTIDLNEAGASILSTKLTIDNGETVGGSHASAGSATPAVISDASIAGFAQVSVDVDQVGSGSAAGGKAYLIGYWTP